MQEVTSEHLARVFAHLRPVLGERDWRLVGAALAQMLGHGGIAAVARAARVGRGTITRGLAELSSGAEPPVAHGRQRRPGGGRKSLTEQDPTLVRDLEALVEPTTRGDPQSGLRWTCKSLRKLAEELAQQGHRVSARKVGDLLHQLDYSLQANRKIEEGSDHPDRDAQFGHINQLALDFQERGQPVVSVDTKKKELVGNFKNAGQEWQPKGQPVRVATHDFPSQAAGKAIPYGVYDVGQNEGWVSVGTDHDTAEFAVATLLQWWQQMGTHAYPDATELLVTADGGGSNSNRCRLWKVALQRFADETGLRVSVCHFPPGTSKWNKIEHRMFSHITQNWRGRPLISHEVVVNLIENTTTRTGLRVRAALDTTYYPTDKKVSDDQLRDVYLSRDPFHGEWNYSVLPRPKLIPRPLIP
jgi:DNA-binding phage protein